MTEQDTIRICVPCEYGYHKSCFERNAVLASQPLGFCDCWCGDEE